MKGLRNRDPHNWWRNVKQVTGLDKKSSRQPLLGFANQLHDDNTQDLADDVNAFFQQVAADFSPLDTRTTLPQAEILTNEFIIDQASVEQKLSWINIFKSPGPDRMPNWILRDINKHVCMYVSTMEFDCEMLDQVRVSIDYHLWKNQHQIGVSSLFVRALGMAPYKDTFWTSSIQPGNKYSLLLIFLILYLRLS